MNDPTFLCFRPSNTEIGTAGTSSPPEKELKNQPLRPELPPVIVMRLLPFFICLFLLGLPWSLSPAPRDLCKGFKIEKQRKTCYEKKFKESDYELNQVYRQLQKELPPDHGLELKMSSRRWIRNKEYFCGFQAELESGRKDPKNATYYSCLLKFTRSRILFLRQGFAREGVKPGKPGSYDDGEGGRLTLKKKTDDRFEFTMEVVRGPTAHIGEIGGAFTLHGRKGEFRSGEFCDRNKNEKDEKEANDTCCRLTFDFRKYHVKVVEQNCSMYHGAKAYFTGEYRKVR